MKKGTCRITKRLGSGKCNFKCKCQIGGIPNPWDNLTFNNRPCIRRPSLHCKHLDGIDLFLASSALAAVYAAKKTYLAASWACKGGARLAWRLTVSALLVVCVTCCLHYPEYCDDNDSLPGGSGPLA